MTGPGPMLLPLPVARMAVGDLLGRDDLHAVPMNRRGAFLFCASQMPNPVIRGIRHYATISAACMIIDTAILDENAIHHFDPRFLSLFQVIDIDSGRTVYNFLDTGKQMPRQFSAPILWAARQDGNEVEHDGHLLRRRAVAVLMNRETCLAAIHAGIIPRGEDPSIALKIFDLHYAGSAHERLAARQGLRQFGLIPGTPA